MKTATYAYFEKYAASRKELGRITLDPIKRPRLYGIAINFDNPQKEIHSGNGIVARLVRFQ